MEKGGQKRDAAAAAMMPQRGREKSMNQEEQQDDHNTAIHNLIETGDVEEVAMILGSRDRLRCGGVIRGGVKALRASAPESEKQKFAELEAKGMSYDDIDRALGGAPKTRTSKLFPRNTDHFILRECDFTRASDARFIRENYSDPDGKVRRIPVWLSVADIPKVLPHGFSAFDGASNLKAVSFYEGKDLRCRYLPRNHVGQGKKAEWLVGKFDPENPVDPAGRAMVFGGMYRLHVAGIKGLDEIIVPTKSWYGLGFSVALLRRIVSITGRFDGLLNGNPFLELVKSPEEVTHGGKKVVQHIPVLEISIDAMELARYAEQRPSRGLVAIQTINGTRTIEAAPERPAIAAPPARLPDPPKMTTSGAAEDDKDRRDAALKYLRAAIASLGIGWDQFIIWTTIEVTFGVGLEEIPFEELRALAEGVRGSIKTEGEVFAEKIRAKAKEYGVDSE
jgi:hypothetical protein